MSHFTEKVKRELKNAKHPFLGEMRHVKAPKIPRHKLQNEFACKGWSSCSLQFQSTPGDNEFDIISSPTKYLPSSKQVESSNNGVKKKPMLAEISNIEPLFLQNRTVSSKVLVNKKLNQTFNNSIPTVNNKQKSHHKRVSSGLLNFQNIQESFENKKLTKFVKPTTESRVIVSDNNSRKVNICSQDDLLSSVTKPSIFNSVTSKSFKESVNDCSNSKLFLKNETTFNSVLSKRTPLLCKSIPLATENGNVSSVQDEINKCELIVNQSCLLKKCSSYKSRNFGDRLTSHCLNNEFQASSVSESVPVKCSSQDLDISNSTEDQSIPKVPVSSEVLKESLRENTSDLLSRSFNQNCLKRPSDLMNLHNLHESFQAKKQCTESDVSPDSIADMIIDDSPLKINKDLSSSILHKLKNFSEIFGADSVDVKVVNKNSSQDIFIQDKNNNQSLKYTVLSSKSAASSLMDDFLATSCKQDDFSDRKSLIFNNKEFLETLQSSYQEKSFSIHKGSNWVQSLNWDQNTQWSGKTSEYNDQIEKKTLKNIVHGGFAEQMLKLQRRERSDKVIWNHKMNDLKKKVAASSVTFTLMSVLFTGNIIMTKCKSESGCEILRTILNKLVEDSRLDVNTVTKGKSDTNILPTSVADVNEKLFIVLFKREIFSKLQLKVGTSFILYPPWETLIVPSLPFPVILCTYFIEPINKIKEVETEATGICSYPVMYKSLQKKDCECDKVFSSLYFSAPSSLYGKSVCVSARVQRIWQNKFMVNQKPSLLLPDDYSSFSVLLQTVDGIFLHLKIISSYMSEAYNEFLTDAESRCFRFCDATITHRFNLRNCFKLKKFIESMENLTTNNFVPSRPQVFLYEIMSCYVKIPKSITEEKFPPYFGYDIRPLYELQKNNQSRIRISCIGKILFKVKEDFFITDESLLGSKKNKYCNLKFSFKIVDKSLIGSIVLIKEAICMEDYLLVDEFSNYEVFSSSRSNINTAFSFESRIKKIGLINYEHILLPLNLQSKVKDLVLVKGTISEVDDSTALSWLECCFCFRENLLEDSNSVIYCEDCSCIVPKPVLNVKMDVTVHCPDLIRAKVKVQLLSTTVKRILKISEGNYQPECNISDVLHKSTGDLCCYIKNIETVSDTKNFQLKEVTI